jgi:DNA-binding NarL/FixJ family response regulator
MTQRISVLIADDHSIVREGLRAVISAEPDMKSIGEAVDGEEARQKALTLKPAVIVMDL